MHAPVDIKFSCTECGQRMLVDPAAAGHVTSCPGCATELLIPEVGELEPAETLPRVPQLDADSNGDAAGWDGDSPALYRAVENAERLEAASAHLQAELNH